MRRSAASRRRQLGAKQMKKHTTAAGPTGMRRLRSLVAFRHHSPAARLLSTLVAFAIAMLLVASTSPAQADDTAPAPADTTVSTDAPAPDPGTSTDAPADTPSDPPADTGGAATDAPSDAPAADSSTVGASTDASGADSASSAPSADATKSKSGPMQTTLKKLAAPTPNLVGNAGCVNGSNTMVGGFEIDGDPCDDEGGIDFNGGPGATTDDGYGDDGNWFTQGSSENDDPATWTLTGNSNTGKADIGTAWAWSHVWHAPAPGDPTDGHVFAYFGFTNDSTAGGTQDYSLEYNQADPVNGKPVRTPGDLLFHFFANGNVALTYEASYIYTDGADTSWDDATCVESGNLGAGWCPFALDPADFVSAASPSGEYVEGSIDITNLFGEGNCSGTFGTTFLRSAPGSFFTSELKDYVAPLGVTTPSTCGTLQLEKKDIDTGDFVGGGIYKIDGDPRPGANPADTLCYYDGTQSALDAILADASDDPDVAAIVAAECDEIIADGTADGQVDVGEVEPGTYTVTEIVPPPGYLLNPEPNPGNSQTVTIGDGDDKTVTFLNHKKWEPLDVTKTADGTFGAQYHWAVNKEIAPAADGPWSDGTDPQNPLLKNVEAGGNTSLYYKVVVTEESVDTSSYVVTGTIHVANPNDAAVDATISESLTGCTLDSNDAAFPVNVSVPAGGADYDYTCALGNGPVDPGTNTATVTWDKSTYPQTTDDIGAAGDFSDQGSDGFTFTEVASIDKTITVTDDHFTFDPAWVITWGDEGDGTYESAVYSFDTETLPGTCSDVITNTATITGDEATLDEDSESGKVCVEDSLAAAVSVDESLTRTFNWAIDKSTTTPPPATITVQNGQATAHYVVNVEALPYVDSNWAMSGTVHITNPNDFTSEQVSTLDIAYSGGGTCAPDNPVLPDIAAGGFADVAFTCDFASEPDLAGDVTATVKWDGDAKSVDADSASVAEADWVLTLVDEFVKVFDDHAVPGVEDPLFGGTQLRWQDVFDSVDPAAHQVDVEYDHTFSGSILPAAGSCKDLTNTAWLTGDGDAPLLDSEENPVSDDATVRVCTPAVVVSPPTPPEVSPPGALPNTGGPDAWVLAAGLVLLLGGSSLVIGDRRRRRRS
jgi:LPXTG-motif cell wall-anchored protein